VVTAVVVISSLLFLLRRPGGGRLPVALRVPEASFRTIVTAAGHQFHSANLLLEF